VAWLRVIILAWLGLGFAAPAAAQDHLTKIRCPPTWPGPDRAGAPLTYAIGWYQYYAILGPGMDGIEAKSGPGDIHLDCAYGPGMQEAPLRITVVVPGHPTHCAILKDRAGKWGPYGCETKVTPEEERRPTVWQMAEVIDRHTTLFGFGLDQSVAAIRATAVRQEFREEESPSKDILAFVRDTDRITVRFSPVNNGSREIIWIVPPDAERKTRAAYDISLRFGYRLEEVLGAITWDPKTGAHGSGKTARPNAKAPVRVERPDEFAEGYHLILNEP